jgi:ABC-type uncharacterized transport system permease subunit
MALASSITASASILAALGEARLDAYVSAFAIAYFALSAILRPRRRTRDFLAAALLMAFSYSVALRVLEVLTRP